MRGYRVICYDSVDSTNDEAKRYVRSGRGEDVVFFAKTQSGGRGSKGRKWESLEGNLHFSVLFKVRVSDSLAQMVFVFALAVKDLLLCEEVDYSRVAFKWPNDVLLDGKKVAGILIESLIQGEEVWIIGGVGINVSKSPQGFVEYPATSLRLCGVDCRTGLQDLVRQYIDLLNLRVRFMEEEGFFEVKNAWMDGAAFINKKVDFFYENSKLSGVFKGINDEGACLVEVDGVTRSFSQGRIALPQEFEGSGDAVSG